MRQLSPREFEIIGRVARSEPERRSLAMRVAAAPIDVAQRALSAMAEAVGLSSPSPPGAPALSAPLGSGEFASPAGSTLSAPGPGTFQRAAYDDGRSLIGAPPVAPEYNPVLNDPFGMREHPIFGGMRMHEGVDIKGPVPGALQGTPQLSLIDGTVTSASGSTVKVTGADGMEVTHRHLDSLSVEEGDTIKAGETIGPTGAKGGALGAHAHIEMRDAEGALIDPGPYLREAMVDVPATPAFSAMAAPPAAFADPNMVGINDMARPADSVAGLGTALPGEAPLGALVASAPVSPVTSAPLAAPPAMAMADPNQGLLGSLAAPQDISAMASAPMGILDAAAAAPPSVVADRAFDPGPPGTAAGLGFDPGTLNVVDSLPYGVGSPLGLGAPPTPSPVTAGYDPVSGTMPADPEMAGFQQRMAESQQRLAAALQSLPSPAMAAPAVTATAAPNPYASSAAGPITPSPVSLTGEATARPGLTMSASAGAPPLSPSLGPAAYTGLASGPKREDRLAPASAIPSFDPALSGPPVADLIAGPAALAARTPTPRPDITAASAVAALAATAPPLAPTAPMTPLSVPTTPISGPPMAPATFGPRAPSPLSLGYDPLSSIAAPAPPVAAPVAVAPPSLTPAHTGPSPFGLGGPPPAQSLRMTDPLAVGISGLPTIAQPSPTIPTVAPPPMAPPTISAPPPVAPVAPVAPPTVMAQPTFSPPPASMAMPAAPVAPPAAPRPSLLSSTLQKAFQPRDPVTGRFTSGGFGGFGDGFGGSGMGGGYGSAGWGGGGYGYGGGGHAYGGGYGYGDRDDMGY